MRATRLPRLHVITDTRGPVAPPNTPRFGATLRDPDLGLTDSLAVSLDPTAVPPAAGPTLQAPQAVASLQRDVLAVTGSAGPGRDAVSFATHRDPLLAIEAALAAGARLVQVRPEDHYTDRAAFDLATAIAALCDQYGAVCLVNDRVHIAQAVGADGVHLGADDLPIDAARRILPAASIIGGTARDPESARAARRAGATYLGVGPVWGTTTKAGLPQPIGLEGLAAVCEAVDLPVIAIGGITAERAALCREAGAHGVAVVGAIASAADPRQATVELLEAVGESPEAAHDDGSRDWRAAGGSRGERFGAVGVRNTGHGDPDAGDRQVGPRSADHHAQPVAADTRHDRLGGRSEAPDTGLLRGVGEA